MPAYSLGATSAWAATTHTPQTFTAPKTFLAGSASDVPITVKGASGQTASLTEWRNSANTVVGSINASGIAKFGSLAQSVSARLAVSTNETTDTGIVIRGLPSQIGKLQEWQNSAGTPLSYVRGDGVFVPNQGIIIGSTLLVDASRNIQAGAIKVGGGTFFSTAGALHVEARSATDVGAQIRGFAGQSFNLQEWQNSAGTIQSNIQPDGTIVTGVNGSFQAYGTSLAPGAGAAALYLRAPTTTTRGLIVRGNASQTMNLVEFQNSNATAVARIDAVGEISATLYSTSGNLYRALQLGNADSAGVGYRAVRVAN